MATRSEHAFLFLDLSQTDGTRRDLPPKVTVPDDLPVDVFRTLLDTLHYIACPIEFFVNIRKNRVDGITLVFDRCCEARARFFGTRENPALVQKGPRLHKCFHIPPDTIPAEYALYRHCASPIMLRFRPQLHKLIGKPADGALVGIAPLYKPTEIKKARRVNCVPARKHNNVLEPEDTMANRAQTALLR
jgi:hypothetical protein